MEKFGEYDKDGGAAAKKRVTGFDEQQEDDKLERSQH